MSAWFPDPERRHLIQFPVAPALDYDLRLWIAGSLVALGGLAQILWRSPTPAAPLIASLPLIFVGNLFLLARGYDLRPKKRTGPLEWEKTTIDRYREVRALERKGRKWDEAATDITCLFGATTLLVIAIVAGGITVFLYDVPAARYWSPVFAADAAVLLLPHWVTGTRRAWRPVGLVQQVGRLLTALQALEKHEDPPRQVQPMLQVRGAEDPRVPVGARVFVRFPDGPEEFLGVQFQVALNDVQGTSYPYLYAVIVARPSLDLIGRWLDEVRAANPDLAVEDNREEDVEVIVIRRRTTKTSGYHTQPRHVRRIAHAALEAVRRVLAKASRTAS